MIICRNSLGKLLVDILYKYVKWNERDFETIQNNDDKERT